MRIEFSKSFEDVSEKELHITKKDVIRTITNPLKKQTVEMDGLKILLFLQKESKTNTYLLVMGQCKGDTLSVPGNCFRLLPELIKKVGNEEPIVLLQQLASNFGVPIKIGSRVEKFFLREFISVPKDAKSSDVIEMEIPAGVTIASLFLRHRKEVGIVECAIAFNIQLKSYLTWLNNKTSVTISARKYDVFISYKRNTAKDFALFLKQCLTEEGYIAFLDLKDIPKEFDGSEKWFDKIDEAIRNSKRFLLIITIRVESSQEVAKELELARTIPNLKFMFLRHDVLKPQISFKFDDETIDLSECNQEAFSTEVDLARKVLQILQDSTK